MNCVMLLSGNLQYVVCVCLSVCLSVIYSKLLTGLFGQNRCPKGKHCNFLHVFRNPGGAYARADLDMQPYSPSRRYTIT